jgi:meiotically up-regulated gene 157 (Mug157) protein
LRTLRDSTDGTGFIHESYSKDDPKIYTRAWFAWANTLFGELLAKLATTRPDSLRPF